jgi:ADP-L-glycero-D-manno-heptose 6-epimerase
VVPPGVGVFKRERMQMIVVTGAAGFIGSNVVAALNASGRHDVVAVDTAEANRQTRNLDGLQVATTLDREQLDAFLKQDPERIDGIIHMGACSDTTNSDRAFMMSNNLEYTQRLWHFCAAHGKRFVYASSGATYGDGSAGYDDRSDPRLLKPLNLYGESKHLFDLWALEQKQAPPVWAGLKFFNVYGPREAYKQRMASMAYHWFNQIKETGRARLFKSDRLEFPDGGQQRDFVYVKDAVAVVLHFFNAPAEKANAVFNVGTGQARTFSDLARAVFSALKLPPRLEFIPMAEDLKGKYQYYTRANTEKLRGSGFSQKFHTIEEGVADYVTQYLMKGRFTVYGSQFTVDRQEL